MLNLVTLVGRLKDIRGEKLTLAITDPHRDKKGVYKTYDIDVLVMGGLRNNIAKYCNKGAVIGVKGRIGKFNKIIAEKISFLSQGK